MGFGWEGAEVLLFAGDKRETGFLCFTVLCVLRDLTEIHIGPLDAKISK